MNRMSLRRASCLVIADAVADLAAADAAAAVDIVPVLENPLAF